MFELTRGAKGDGVIDDTAVVTAAINTDRAIHITDGTYLCAPFSLGVGQNLEGEGAREGNDGIPTVLLCATNSGTPSVFLRIPAFNRVKDLKVKATAKTAGWTGVRLSQTEYGWANHIELDTLEISGWDLGLAVNSAFLCRFKDIYVINNRYGARWLPSDDSSDNGYYTTQSFDGLTCAGNDDVGLSITPVGISSTFDFQKLDIENNCRNSGDYQAYMQNIRGRIGTLYGEATSTFPRSKNVPLLQLKSVKLEIDNGYINGTKGINLGSDDNDVTLINCKGVTTDDIVRGTGGANQSVTMIRCTFAAWPFLAAGTRLIMEDCTIAGTYYPGRNDSYWSGSNFIGQSIRDVRSWRMLITATIQPGQRVRIVANTDISYGGAAGWVPGTVGYASFSNFSHEDLLLKVTTASDGNGNFFNVHAYHMGTGPNGDGEDPTPIEIINKTLNITLIRANNPIQL